MNYDKYDGVIDCYQKALEIKESALLFFHLGDSYYKQGMYEESEAAFRKCLELNPEYPHAKWYLSMCLKAQHKSEDVCEDARNDECENTYEEICEDVYDPYIDDIDTYDDTEDTEDTSDTTYEEYEDVCEDIPYIDEISEIEEGEEDESDEQGFSYEDLGDSYCEKREWESAIESYEHALRDGHMECENEVLFKMGDANYELARYEEAESAFRKCLETDPSYPFANYSLGMSLKSQKRYADAIFYLERGAEVGTGEEVSLSYAELGDVYSTLKDWKRAVESYEEALARTKSDALFYSLGNAYYELEDYAQAEFAYKKCLDMNPSYPSANRDLAISLSYQKKFEEAIEFFNKSIEIGSESERKSAYMSLGNIYSDMQELDKAIECYEEALELEESASLYYNVGNAYDKLEDYPQAEYAFRKCLDLDPEYPYANYCLAKSLFHLGRSEEAFLFCDKSIEVGTDEELALTYGMMANVLLHEDVDRAVEYYEKAIKLSGPQSDGHMFSDLGYAYREQKDYAKAESAYRKCLEINPADPYINNHLGLCLHAQGKYQDAITCYEKAIEVGSEEEQQTAYGNIGSIYYKLEDWESAIKYYEKAIAIRDASHPAWLFCKLGNAYYEQKDYAHAESAYRKCLDIDPLYPDANTALGLCIEAQGKPEDAIAFYEKAAETGPDEEKGAAYGNLGSIFFRLEDWENAIKYYEKAIEISEIEHLAWLLYKLGSAYYEQKDYAHAESAYQKCLDIDPLYPNANTSLGLCFEAQEKYEDAIACYEKCIVLRCEKQVGSVYEMLGAIYYHLENWQRTILNYKKALKSGGVNDEGQIFFKIGYAYEQLGDHVHAESAYRKCLDIDPLHVDANICLGLCISAQGKYEDAIACYEKSIVLGSEEKSSLVYEIIGDLYYFLENWQRSILNYRYALEEGDKDDDAELFFRIGHAYYELGDYAQAETAYFSCLDIDPAYPRANNNLGLCMSAQGKYKDAISFFDNGIDLGVDMEYPYHNKFKTLITMDEPDAALLFASEHPEYFDSEYYQTEIDKLKRDI